MKQVWCLLVCVPLWVKAQEEMMPPAFDVAAADKTSSLSTALRTNGIQWIEGLSFQEVQEKAKKENKYIFLDCHATWCGPCKDMDKNIFTKDSIGDFFNQHFLSLKVQMDKTENDEEQVKRWYDDADAIGKQYRIDGFPSFIFLSPQGVLLQQETGYKKASEFLSLAKTVTSPGRVYEGPYAEYDRLVAEYKQGILHYNRMVYMINIAQEFDTVLARPLTKLYGDYVNKLDAAQRYTKDNIRFWSGYVLNSSSPTFQFFYKDHKEIDRVMQQQGFSAEVVDKTVYYEMVVPFLNEQNSNKAIPMSGMYMSGGQLRTDSSEADWKKLFKAIRQKFNNDVAKRNLLIAKNEWYVRHLNYQQYCINTLVQLRKYPPDPKKQADVINTAAWNAFLYVTNKAILNSYIKWMKEAVTYYPKSDYLLDTYANLLYKVGRKKDAIVWEEKAVLSEGRNGEEYKITLKKMRQGEPTNGIIPL